MRRLSFAWSLTLAVIAGCAHHNANQYAYAPPLAPPVYPQPQLPAPGLPASPGPAAVMAAPAVSAAPPMAVVGPPAAGPDGVVVAADPCCPPLGSGEFAGMPVVYETSEQTPPCAPTP